MSIAPIITFKAGICDVEVEASPPKVTARPTPGYLYLYEEDELFHFCWRPRSASMASPDLDLNMIPGDGRFVPYKDAEKSSETTTKSPTNGRIFVLKFQSSTQRHFFWLQAKSQHPQGDAAWFSPRDLKIGNIVDRILQGDEVNPQQEISDMQNGGSGGGSDGDDATMEDVEPDHPGDTQRNQGSGGDSSENTRGNSGPGVEGSHSAAMPPLDATTAVQNFLRSMQGSQALQSGQAQSQGKLFTTLADLLPPSTTIDVIDSAPPNTIDNLLSHVPPMLLLLGQQADVSSSSAESNSETVRAALEAMGLEQKKEILRKVLRSPQFTQSLSSLTGALREGGLPSISDALQIPVENGGQMKGGTVPLGGGEAVEAFVNGVKSTVEESQKKNEGRMETD